MPINCEQLHVSRQSKIVGYFELPNAGNYVELVIALKLNQDGKSRWRLLREVNAELR